MTEYLALIQSVLVLITCVTSLVIGIVILRWSASLEVRMTRIDTILHGASREQVIDLIEKINEAQKGGHLIDWQGV